MINVMEIHQAISFNVFAEIVFFLRNHGISAVNCLLLQSDVAGNQSLNRTQNLKALRDRRLSERATIDNIQPIFRLIKLLN